MTLEVIFFFKCSNENTAGSHNNGATDSIENGSNTAVSFSSYQMVTILFISCTFFFLSLLEPCKNG